MSETVLPNEAGFSITFKMQDAHNNEAQITMRGATADDWRHVLGQRKAMVEETTKYGWKLVETKPATSAATATTAAQPAAKSSNGTNGGDGNTFHATKLKVAFTEDGKKKGKLFGGKYTQFGVTLWPEVATALGYDLETMQPGEYPVDMVVSFSLNDKGQPQKVTGRVQ